MAETALPLETPRRRTATTPARLRSLSIAIAAAALALSVIGAGALVAADVTVTGIQQRTVPSIVAMQRIHAWLADADRSAANAYLAGGAEVTLPELQYQADIAAASRELQAASEHNPGGADASERLQTISTLVDQYVELVQTASVDDRLGVPAGTVYLQAGTNLMHQPDTGILARVDALRVLYAAGLDRANRTLQGAALLLTLYVLVAVLLLWLLVRTQRFLRRRFHRRRSPRLLVATALLLVVATGSSFGAVQAGRTIHAAEDQRYARLLNLWNARALLYDANLNESLGLILRASGVDAESFDLAFATQTKRLVDRPLTDELVRDAERGRVRFNGLLADELRAATGGEERGAAMKVVLVYRKFLDADAAMRALAAQGRQPEAIVLALGTDQGQLTFAFADVDWYLGVAIERLQEQFDDGAAEAERTLAATAALSALALAIAALTFWAVQPRIDEYRAGRRR